MRQIPAFLKIGPALLALILVIGLADLTSPLPVKTQTSYQALLCLGIGFLYLRRFSEDHWRHFLTVALILSIGIGALAFVQSFGSGRARGPFVSANFLGGYAALHLFLAAHMRQHTGDWFSTIAAAANAISLAFSDSRGALLAFAAGALALIWMERRRGLIWLIALALTAGAVATTHAASPLLDNPRLGIWVAGLKIAAARPLLGWGQNTVALSGLDHFYSVPLEWLIAGGALGLLAWLWLVTAGLAAARHYPAIAALIVAYLVNGLFIFDTPGTVIPFFVALGYLGSKARNVDHFARRIDEDDPFLDRRVRAGRTQ